MKECWKDIIGFEKKYQVSNLGRVRSLDRLVICKNGKVVFKKGRILKQQIASGYAQIYLPVDGKQKWFKVHKLVAEAFVPSPNNYPIVNHINGNTLLNSIDNLEWCDYSYNIIDGIIRRKGMSVSVEKYLEVRETKKREYIRRYSKKYYLAHKDYYKEYYRKNREKILAKNKKKEVATI